MIIKLHLILIISSIHCFCTDIIDYINSSTYQSINNLISELISDIYNENIGYDSNFDVNILNNSRNVKYSYSFYHNYSSNLNEIITYDSNCSCYYNCSAIIQQLASISDKQLPNYLFNIYKGKLQSDIWKSLQFGWFFIDSNIESIDKFTNNHIQNYNLNNLDNEIEFGGGSGMGLQIYCNNYMVMSLGAGGGGGFERHLDISHKTTNVFSSKGGGGGGGIQISNQFINYSYHLSTYNNSSNISVQDFLNDSSSDFWWNAGGGGGCGVCNKESDKDICRNDGDILCGIQHDYNSITNRQSIESIKFFSIYPENILNQLSVGLSTCQNLLISGGGGGGGGMDKCCIPEQIGYGFSFNLRSSLNSGLTFRLLRTDILNNELKTIFITNQEYLYNPIGLLFYLSSIIGNCSDISDWCCVCPNAKYLTIYCSNITNIYSDVCQYVTKDSYQSNQWIQNIVCCGLFNISNYISNNISSYVIVSQLDNNKSTNINQGSNLYPNDCKFYWYNISNYIYYNDSLSSTCFNYITKIHNLLNDTNLYPSISYKCVNYTYSYVDDSQVLMKSYFIYNRQINFNILELLYNLYIAIAVIQIFIIII